MSRPSVSQAEAWQPEALRRLADAWDWAAQELTSRIDAAMTDTNEFWSGAAAESARDRARMLVAQGDAVARALLAASVAARGAADQIATARSEVLHLVATARAEGFVVTDDGSVTAGTDPAALLVALSGGGVGAAREMLAVRAGDLTRRLTAALDSLGTADTDAAGDLEEALDSSMAPQPAPTTPAGAWPVQTGDVVAAWPNLSQDRIANQIAAMTPAQRERLVAEFPRQVGNTDGVPWDLRIAANRVNVAQAIVDDPGGEHAAFYRTLLAEVDDPARGGRRVDRQLLAFDPGRSSLVELHGTLSAAGSVAVLVPGTNTTMAGSSANAVTARRFVSATRGEVAAISYLGGPFPRGDNLAAALFAAADPRYALDMAPRLVAFSEDVDRTVDAEDRPIPVTYIGHSYGGSILGTAEAFGLTADRTLYVAAAGAGVGVDDPSDWHNRNPQVVRFSMTPPGDLIQAVQGIPGGPHGADPDQMPGVTRLDTGHYDDGRRMAGPQAHSDVLNAPSDSWRTILAVITGD